ncbi:MAG: sporulation transcriptional regulator SpoIIID [Clostridia bacterium]|nr:sporulation transcriptional regulator SpoIIID [Clostridia bacterium]
MAYFSQPRRCELIGNYIVEYGCTVRAAAQYFGISKSTVHKDVTVELQGVNRCLFERVQDILQKNKNERHLRGGEATRQKYKNSGEKKNI